MGQIVAAMVSCHAPALFLRQPGEDPAQLDATIEGMRRLGQVLDDTKPDALIVVGLDHLEAFSLDVSPAFAVVVGPEVTGSFGRKQYRVKVHQDLGRALLDGCLQRDIDMAFCHKAFMGHAFVVPFEFILEQRRIPIVPVFVNVYVPPLPQPQRAYQLGRCIAEIIAERGERIGDVDLHALARVRDSGVYALDLAVFETDRAQAAGRAVQAETRRHRSPASSARVRRTGPIPSVCTVAASSRWPGGPFGE